MISFLFGIIMMNNSTFAKLLRCERHNVQRFTHINIFVLTTILGGGCYPPLLKRKLRHKVGIFP